MLIHPAFVRHCELEEAIDQGCGVRISHARNAIGVPTDSQRLTPGFRMDLHQRPQWHIRNVEAVTDIFAITGLGFFAQFCLAVREGMMG